MDVAQIFNVLVPLFGGLIALIGLAHQVSNARGKRYLERSTGLLGLKRELAGHGEVSGPMASNQASLAHHKLLQSLDYEARANSVLYLQAASRLNRPGSYLAAVFLVLYAGIMGSMLVTGLGEPEMYPQAEAREFIYWTQLAITALLVWLGCWQVLRRRQTRQIRQTIGAIDPLTFEGAIHEAKEWRRAFRSTANMFGSPSTPSGAEPNASHSRTTEVTPESLAQHETRTQGPTF